MSRPIDSLHTLFSGNFHKPSAPSCVYVAALKNYKLIRKIGISQLPFREWRWGDEEYGNIHKQVIGTRLECWLVEQRILAQTERFWHCPKKLLRHRWPGFTELRRVGPHGFDKDKIKGMCDGIMVNIRRLGIKEYVNRYMPSDSRLEDLRQEWLAGPEIIFL